MGRLQGKVAFITGGSSGIGRAMSYLFADEGAKIAIADINEENGNKIISELKAKGSEAMFVPLDVTDEDKWKAALKTVISEFDYVNIVVNAAGVGGEGKSIEETTMDDWNRIIDINLKGVYLGTKHGILSMKDNGKNGSIINLSSIAGLVGDDQLTIYSASKGGVKLLTKSAALYCAEHKLNIRVNSIHPGYIDTPMVEGEIASGHATREELDDMHPIGHIGEPMDIAYGALYLASDESKFVTGSELVIDGGYTAK